jgi:hypothetical protein
METFYVRRVPMNVTKTVVRDRFNALFGPDSTLRVSYLIKVDRNNVTYRTYFVRVKTNDLVDNFVKEIQTNGVARIYAKPTYKVDLAVPSFAPASDEVTDDWVDVN